MTEDDDRELLAGLKRLLQRVNQTPDDDRRLTALGERLERHLGVDPSTLPLVRHVVPPHRLVDLDLALSALAEDDPDAALFGIGGGQERQHEDFSGLVRHRYARFGDDGPLEYTAVATGPRSSRQVVTSGIRVLRWEGVPIAVLQRGPERRSGRDQAQIEVLSPDPDATTAFLERVRELMTELSVVRGQVVTFAPNEYGQGVGMMTFLDRPDVTASDVVHADGVLERIRGHVVGIGEHAARLRRAGQHLKRGVLLYGPPGTGKTLTVRHLLRETPGTTAVLLQGAMLGMVGEATRLARAMTPSLVVLEDVDLVANERGMFGGPQPLLFQILDALDGLDGDADVAFVLTTNRADILEPALAARPGRIDLAVEIGLPDAAARRVLFRLYGSGLGVSDAALDAAADRAEGVTASFAKELMRRATLRAAEDGRPVVDADVADALDEMLAAAEGVARALFGGDGVPRADDRAPRVGAGSVGGRAYAPGAAGGAMDSTLRIDLD